MRKLLLWVGLLGALVAGVVYILPETSNELSWFDVVKGLTSFFITVALMAALVTLVFFRKSLTGLLGWFVPSRRSFGWAPPTGRWLWRNWWKIALVVIAAAGLYWMITERSTLPAIPSTSAVSHLPDLSGWQAGVADFLAQALAYPLLYRFGALVSLVVIAYLLFKRWVSSLVLVGLAIAAVVLDLYLVPSDWASLKEVFNSIMAGTSRLMNAEPGVFTDAISRGVVNSFFFLKSLSPTEWLVYILLPLYFIPLIFAMWRKTKGKGLRWLRRLLYVAVAFLVILLIQGGLPKIQWQGSDVLACDGEMHNFHLSRRGQTSVQLGDGKCSLALAVTSDVGRVVVYSNSGKVIRWRSPDGTWITALGKDSRGPADGTTFMRFELAPGDTEVSGVFNLCIPGSTSVNWRCTPNGR